MTDTKKIEDGGPAFQTFRQHALGSVEEVNPGMSLRDWFAGQALSGLLACDEAGGEGTSRYPELCDAIAEASYAYADAMLIARKGGA